jgi:hypothetical protein
MDLADMAGALRVFQGAPESGVVTYAVFCTDGVKMSEGELLQTFEQASQAFLQQSAGTA